MVNRTSYQTVFLFRFFLKRERVKLLIWILSFLIMTLSVAIAFTGLYQNEQERAAMAETMKNPAMAALVGQGYGLDNYTDGAMLAHQMLLMTAVVVAIMNIILVVNLTRGDEEEGMLEMIRALPIGRLAPTHAVVLVVGCTNIALAGVIAAGLSLLNIASIDVLGSLLYGSVLGATGLFFASVTLLFAQLANNTRASLMLSFIVLGIAYFVRAIGDAGNNTISWFSPLGLVLGAEVFVNNYWWPILFTLFLSGCLYAVALYLNFTRDMGVGFLPSRIGKQHASRWLQSPLGLALRLQRLPLICWVIGMFVIGASYGSVLGDLDTFFQQNEVLKQMLASDQDVSITEQFLSMLMVIMAIIATVPVVMTLMKVKSEEKKQRIEHLLARAVSRTKLLGSYVVIAFGTSVVMLLVAVSGLASTGLAVLAIDTTFATLVQAMLVYLPALWVMVGLSVLLVGVAPKVTALSWFYILFTFVVVYLGQLLDFPTWMASLSPFAHIPELPMEMLRYKPLIVLTMLAVALTFIGFLTINKRDVNG